MFEVAFLRCFLAQELLENVPEGEIGLDLPFHLILQSDEVTEQLTEEVTRSRRSPDES